MKQAAPHRQSHRVSRHINPPSLAGHECLLVGFDGVGHANRYRKPGAGNAASCGESIGLLMR